MKKIVLILGNPITESRKTEILSAAIETIKAQSFPFDIKLYNENLATTWLDECSIAITAYTPINILNNFKNLQLIVSLNAGVEDILPQVSARDLMVVKAVNKQSLIKMQRYVLYWILAFNQQMQRWQENRKLCIWDRSNPFEKELQIGILGLGNVGKGIALVLLANGFNVVGYSLSEKKDLPFTTFTDLKHFLAGTNVVVNTLPLTDKTEKSLNKDFFDLLSQGAYLINIGRGGHIDNPALISALESGKLEHAVLDVFEKEPLPADHSFWKNPKITITPHISGVFSIFDNLKAALEICKEFTNGKTVFTGQVNLRKGY